MFLACEEVLHKMIFLPSAFWFPQIPTCNDLCTGIDGANVCVLLVAMPGTHGSRKVGKSRVIVLLCNGFDKRDSQGNRKCWRDAPFDFERPGFRNLCEKIFSLNNSFVRGSR